jgi:hypothetical protein
MNQPPITLIIPASEVIVVLSHSLSKFAKYDVSQVIDIIKTIITITASSAQASIRLINLALNSEENVFANGYIYVILNIRFLNKKFKNHCYSRYPNTISNCRLPDAAKDVYF